MPADGQPLRVNRVGGGATDRSYVVVACAPYSGSTLLASLLGSHPEIATVSELSGKERKHRMAEFRCSCQRLMIDCPFWRQVQDQMKAIGYADFELADFGVHFGRQVGRLHRIRTGSLHWAPVEELRDTALNLVPAHNQALHTLGRRNQALANVVLEITGKRVFVDASKEPMRLGHLNRHLDMDLRAVHLVRDVRGAVASSKRRYGAQTDVGAAAKAWARTNATLMRHLNKLESHRHTLIRYEDLCRDPAGTMASLYAFCRVDASVAPVLSYETQHLLGSRGRLESTTEIRLDDGWRSSLSRHELARVWEASRSVMRSVYPSAVGPWV